MAWTNPTTRSAGDAILASDQAIWVGNQIAGHPLVTSLPSSPSDGDTIYYQSASMASLSIAWTLRYRSGGGTYKWEFVGGAPLYVNFDTSRTRAAQTYDAITDAVEVTNPLAGVYVIEHGCNMGYTTGGPGNGETWATVKLGTAAAADAEGIAVVSSSSGMTYTASRSLVRTLASSMTIAQQYKSPVGTTSTFRYRWVQIRPVAVG